MSQYQKSFLCARLFTRKLVEPADSSADSLNVSIVCFAMQKRDNKLNERYKEP